MNAQTNQIVNRTAQYSKIQSINQNMNNIEKKNQTSRQKKENMILTNLYPHTEKAFQNGEYNVILEF